MKIPLFLRSAKYLSGLLLLVFSLSPVFAQAETRSGDSWWSRYRGESELSQKISQLGVTASPSITIPILFGVSLKNISPNFGDPRDGGARTHQGEDIMAIKGTPVVSPTPAVVVKTGVGPSEGNYVYTANPGNETFVYMHLDRIGEGVSQGTVLAAGDLIGYVGNTGNARGGAAHLHFEIHNSSGAATNPFPRLTSELSLTDKMAHLTKILGQTSDPASLAQFLATKYKSTFTAATGSGVVIPTQIATLIGSPITTITASVPSTAQKTLSSLSRNLTLNSRGEDVRLLQKMLNEKGFTVAVSGAGSFGNETTFFGPATRRAVIKFQLANSIAPAIGYVGPLTRGALA